MRSLWNSFRCAFRGIFRAAARERNMRIHMTLAFYALLLGVFFPLSRTQFGILCLTIALVTASEVFNTALERLCDSLDPGYNRNIRLVKDLSSGAVLLSAFGAAAVGAAFFLRVGRLRELFFQLLERPAALAALLLSLAAAFFFIRGRKPRP